MKKTMDEGRRADAQMISEEVLNLMNMILESWRQLDKLVQAEWKAVLRGEFTMLYRFSRGKEILSDHIESYETRLKEIMLRLMPEAALIEPEKNILAKFLDHLPFSERRQVMDFYVQRANLKIQVAFTNRRTMMWIRERMDFSSELLEILTGNKLRKSVTYAPPERSILYRKAPGFDILSREEDARNAAGHTGKNCTKGINAYHGMQAEG